MSNQKKSEIKFTHIVGCRYNHDLYTGNAYNINDKDQWMEDRLVKFKKLLSSLENQTCLNFKFLIFIDKNTPENLKRKLKDFITNNLTKVDWEVIETRFNIYLKNIKIESKYLITSRIDNDDEYLPNFVKTVQESFNSCDEVIDVIGVQYDNIKDKFYTSGRLSPNSPFISLVEKSEDIKSVYCYSHTNMCKHFKCRFSNSGEVNYIQNIHNNNIMNKIIGKEIEKTWI